MADQLASLWDHQVLLWVDTITGEVFMGGRWADANPGERMPYKITIVRWAVDGPAPRCEARDLSLRAVCAMWPHHDGPHISITEELDAATGGITITGMQSQPDPPRAST